MDSQAIADWLNTVTPGLVAAKYIAGERICLPREQTR